MTACKVCGRALRSAASIARGAGPKCAKEATLEQQEHLTQFEARVQRKMTELPVDPIEVFIVSSEPIKRLILGAVYDGYVSTWGADKLEVKLYPDFILYQAEHDDEAHTAVQQVENSDLFIQIRKTLQTPQEGVWHVGELSVSG